MTLNMLVFEFREAERKFFDENTFENYDISFYETPLTPENLNTIPQDVLDKTNIISVFINSELDEKVINAFKNLRIVSTRSTGYNHINTNACRNKNIAVLNVENYGSSSIAQFTFGLIILLVRKFLPAYMSLKNCEKSNAGFSGRNISKLTLGVIGTGAIGAEVCKIAKCFSMRVLAYDIVHKKELEEDIGLKYVSLDELLNNSDIVTVHVPYTGTNYHMIGELQFDMMKDGSYFINTSRGEIIDIVSLYNQIESGKIQGAALDALICESVSFSCDKLAERLELKSLECATEVKYMRRLMEFENVIITPHIAYDTQEAVDYILEETMCSINDVFYGGKSSRVV